MTDSSGTSKDLQDSHGTADMANSEKYDSLDTVYAADPEKQHTLDTENRPPAAESTVDVVKSPLPQAVEAGEWSSPEDPENPMNWSTAKKAYHAAIPSVLCFTVYVKDMPVR